MATWRKGGSERRQWLGKSMQDMTGYPGYYGKEFQTPKGISRKTWTDERYARIESKNEIDIKIESPQVAIAGNTAAVKFRQSYQSFPC